MEAKSTKSIGNVFSLPTATYEVRPTSAQSPRCSFHGVPQWPSPRGIFDEPVSQLFTSGDSSLNTNLKHRGDNLGGVPQWPSPRGIFDEPVSQLFTSGDSSLNTNLKHRGDNLGGVSYETDTENVQCQYERKLINEVVAAHLDAQVPYQSDRIVERVMERLHDLFAKFEQDIGTKLSETERRVPSIQSASHIASLELKLSDAVATLTSRMGALESSIMLDNSGTCLAHTAGKVVCETKPERAGHEPLVMEATTVSSETFDLLNRLKRVEDNIRGLTTWQEQEMSKLQEQEKKLEQEVAVIEENNEHGDGEAPSSNTDFAHRIIHMLSGERQMDYPMYYEIQASTWDTTLFLYLGVMNLPDSILSAISCLLTVFIQMIFVLIVARSMTDDELTEAHIQQLEHWRYSSAHDINYYDPFTDTSLATRVCHGTWDLRLSSTQTELFDSFNSFLGKKRNEHYLEDIAFLNNFDGGVLSGLCFFLWTLSCQRELFLIMRFFQAMNSKLGKGHTSMFRQDNQFSLERLGPRRFACVMLLSVVPRSLLLAALYYYGSKFLLYTSDMSELLLNAVALAFILDIDDEIYEVFAPFSAKAIQNNIDPIQIARVSAESACYAIVDVSALLTLVVIVGTAAMTYSIHLMEFVGRMTRARAAICEGDQNFVTVQSRATDQLFYHWTSPPGNVFKADHSQVFSQEATRRLANINSDFSNAEQIEYGIFLENVQELRDLFGETAQEAADRMNCIDQFDHVHMSSSELTATSRALYHQLNGYYTSCAQIEFVCSDHRHHYHSAINAARALCPVTCECANASAGLYDLSGCPKNCAHIRYEDIIQTVRRYFCWDRDVVNHTRYMHFYKEYEEGLRNSQTLSYTLAVLGVTNSSLSEAAGRLGCNLTAEIMRFGIRPSPCEIRTYFGSALAFCPGSCRASSCSSGNPLGGFQSLNGTGAGKLLSLIR